MILLSSESIGHVAGMHRLLRGAAMEPDNHEHWKIADELYASPGARGSYNPLHFVVRLKPEFFALLDSHPGDFVTASSASGPEVASAFSTFFHETIHWWQHIGSTTGFMLSMAYPAQTHVNRPHPLTLLQEIGPVKSLLGLHQANKLGMSAVAEKALNTVLNNGHDVELNRRIIIDPTPAVAEESINSPYFVGIGHSLEIGLAHTLWLLTATVDPEQRFFPDIRTWESGFEKLRQAKHEGYYPGSRVMLSPVGARHIFEGQARFNQLQYLHFASNGKMAWKEFESGGMLSGVYITAFEKFLDWAELDWPDTPIDPIVSLFLLICDLAINPSDGFPFDITHFESFLESNSPAIRFFLFSRHIARTPGLLKSLNKLTREEYLEVSNSLCKMLVCKNPVEIAEHMLGWIDRSERLQGLMEEERTYNFRFTATLGDMRVFSGGLVDWTRVFSAG
ncbi:MAG: hypothetical protein C0467_31715 [Planctomycetaceae bacterium]|nr:hypothetical protein [Planctomycetaceae bacterium]